MTVDQLRAALKDLPGDLTVYLPLRSPGSRQADELATVFLGRVKEEEFGNLLDATSFMKPHTTEDPSQHLRNKLCSYPILTSQKN